MKGRVLGAINACVVVIALSVNATNANASVFNFTFTGVFTVQDSAGDFLLNTDATGNSWAGYRTDVAGTYSLDDVTGSGFVTVTPFDFLGGGPVQFTSGATQYIGDGFGNPGTLTLGNFTFDWSGNTGINMDLVWDTSGLLDALSMNMSPGDIISGNQVIIAGNAFPIVSALPASAQVCLVLSE